MSIVENDKIHLSIHPDTLLDEDYQELEIEKSRFANPSYDFEKCIEAEHGVYLADKKSGFMRAEACSDNVIRISFSKKLNAPEKTTTEALELITPYSEDKAKYSWEFHDKTLAFDNNTMSVRYSSGSNEFTVKDKDDNILVETIYGGVKFAGEAEYSGESTLTYFKLDKEEEVFGFGGRIYHPNRTGKSADIFSEKAGLHFGDYGGFPVPFFISTKGYGVFFNNPWPHVYFDMGKTKADEWFVYSPGGDCDFFIIKGNNFEEILKNYTYITGRVTIPEKWMLGLWCSSILSLSEADQAVECAKRMHEEGYPCDAVVLDGSWRGGKNFFNVYMERKGYLTNDFNWHPEFGDGAKMINDLLDIDVKTVLHINSRSFTMNTIEEYAPKGLLRVVGEETVPMLLDEAGEKLYAEFLTPRIKENVAAWWTDHSDRVSGELKSGIPSRNLFGVVWNRFLQDLMAKNGVNKHMSLSRGGGIGSQRYALPWPGDTGFGLNRFEEDIWFCLNAGLAGFSLSGFDIGGFTSNSYYDTQEIAYEAAFNMENICRRVCPSFLFSPIPRIHNGSTVGKFPWYCPEETRALYKECLTKRYELTPYIYSYTVLSHYTGAPILRPLVYHHKDDKNVYNIGNEFYMGDYLLIAPVTEGGVDSRLVYLPEGEWINMWTHQEYEGCQEIKVDAPLTKIEGIPLFVKKGGVIVYQEVTLTLKDEAPDKLTIEFYPHEQAFIELYESESIKNEFKCEMKDGINVYLQNNTLKDRVYMVKVFCDKPSVKLDDKIIVAENGYLSFEVKIGRYSGYSCRLTEI